MSKTSELQRNSGHIPRGKGEQERGQIENPERR